MNIKFKNTTYLIILLILLNSVGSVFNLINNFEDPENLKADKFEYPYIDEGCKWSKTQINSFFNNLNSKHNVEFSYFFYDHPSRSGCQGRPVISNLYDKKISQNKNEIIPIGIGVNPDVNNFLFFTRSILIFISLIFFYNNFTINKLNFKNIKLNSLTYLTLVLFIYGFLVFPSYTSAISDILLYVFFGNIIIYYFIEAHSFKVAFKSILTLIIFPLFFYDSNVSFWWLFILTAINIVSTKNIKFNKLLIILIFLFCWATYQNLKDFYFEKKLIVGEWILFAEGRHKGGIVDISDGYQTLAYLFDTLILIFIFYILFLKYKTEFNELEKDFSDSLIAGFIIWLFSYIISQIHPILNYYVSKFLGLNENIDTINSYHPDGINWRGVTSSHELTGFWLFIIFCLIINKIIVSNKKIYYLPHLIAVSIAINLNSQKTTILLIAIYFLFLFLKNFRSKNILILTALFITLTTAFLQNSSSYNRLATRIENIDFNFEIDDGLRWKITESFQRYDKYNLSIKQPSYDFKEVSNYSEFYAKELNTKNKFIINIFNYLTKIFGREYQWFRFFYFTEFTSDEVFYGNGAGQSHQHLVQLIEKPHSLYFSLFYQFGFLGLMPIVFLIYNLLKYFIKFQHKHVYILGLFFFIVGIKAEMIFTHNQFILFTCFMYYCFFLNKEEINK